MALTLDEAKEYLRIDGDEDDNLVSFFISAPAQAHGKRRRKGYRIGPI
nr:head-tail connector protein [Bacillus subtilis]